MEDEVDASSVTEYGLETEKKVDPAFAWTAATVSLGGAQPINGC